MEKNMATDEKDNTHELCLPHELLANDDLNYHGGISKSRQKLKDLLLSVDTKESVNTNSVQHDLSVTSLSNSSDSTNFSSCVRENRNPAAISEPSDLNKSDLNSCDVSLTKHCLKEVIKTQFAETNFGPYTYQNHASIDNGLESVAILKHQTQSVDTEGKNRVVRKQSLIEKVLREDERSHTPNICYEDADAYMFQDSSYDSTIPTGFDTDDEWDMAINAENSPNLTTVSTSKKGMPPRILLIQQQGTTDTLKQQITQVVGDSNMTVLYLEECLDVNNKAEMCPLIWFHVLSPINKQATDVMTLLRSNGNKNVTYIVVSDKMVKDELPIPADVFVEPLTKEMVERLCSLVKGNNVQNIPNLPVKQNAFVRNVSSTPESTISSASGRTSIGSPHRNHSPPRWCRVEHATKEKQRRERIKDSCDQLRLLLPYVKGRKTDMASILEMTVDYLKIVNSALSQDFHSQVIDIMSSGSPPLNDDVFGMNMAYKKSARKDQDGLDVSPALEKEFHSAPNKVDAKATKSCKDGNLNKRMMTRSLSRTLTSATDEINTQNSNSNKSRRNVYGNMNNGIIVAKRECSTTKTGSSNPKKPRITLAALNNKQPRAHEASTASLAVKEYKTENAVDDMPSQNQVYHNFQFPHMFTDGDISANRMFSSGHVSSNDGFASYVSHSQINLQSTHNIGDRLDMNNYGNVYFDGPYIPYSYSNMQDSSNGNYYGTEYVNPNAVLPVTSYTPRVSAFASGRKFERTSTSNSDMLQGDSADVYNNNTV